MDDHLMRRAHDRGFITRPEILDSGYGDRDIRDAIRAGVLTRVGAGLYAPAPAYRALDDEAKLAARSRAVFHRHRGAVVLTHQSAAAVHGIAMWGAPLDEVHVTRLDRGRGRHEAHVQHHVGHLDESDVVEVDGVLVSRPERCVWELACEQNPESALVSTDAALHRGLVTAESLGETAAQFRTWRGSRSGRLALSLADGRSESPGESRSRYLFWKHGIPRPDLQFRVRDAHGLVVARTDFAWELYRHLAEFDGRIKFDGTFSPEGFETVFDEKRREDLVRAELWGLTRLVWVDLGERAVEATMGRLRGDLERSRSLYARHIA
ncbi:type IV toxin-antitoxin system AbiEi family antitoxin domain-containing protein [Aeromicrobium sp. CFBP 8757]|uniref:type IV toxin-antitoxin system AbiEi family antitoxin domain-containing protein n=1 Tax=Aeromicrobium sp. CFBP 8757 TaxID=2775288 RepID=UPI0017814BAE|nr:type IV toxin-antitoxin system AbiEi family antitoxin domain-containing protein [Aeromicrobium sp. CFBP 8757]MBD8606942.1 type IV toxin-antitoxin system AbiEi family antitoxin domain-containing protein [Aeromicrobium sp. CFBP 8757]